MTAQAILKVWGAQHRYGSRPVLRGTDLTVRAGEIYALVGPSGAGKSTLIGAICGRFPLTAGEVSLYGDNPLAAPAARARLGLAPQECGLYERLTVRENLEAFGRLAGVRRRDLSAAVARALRLTRTEDCAQVPARNLSGVCRRLANIAAAILHDPRLLIVDEPAVGVEAQDRGLLDAVIGNLRHPMRAVLVVTCDLDQAGGVADRVGFLREGRVVLEGEPRALVAQAFGEELEIVVRLDDEVDVEGERVLGLLGLERRKGDAWTRLDGNPYVAARKLDRRLRALGLRPRDVTVREPSLENLFGLVADWSRAA